MPSITISDDQISWAVRLSSSKLQVGMIDPLHQVLPKTLERRGKRDLQLKLHHHHTTNHASCYVCFDRTQPGNWRRRIITKSVDKLCKILSLIRRSQSAKNWRGGAAVLYYYSAKTNEPHRYRWECAICDTTMLWLFRGWEGRMYCYNWVIMERWSYITRQVRVSVRIALLACPTHPHPIRRGNRRMHLREPYNQETCRWYLVYDIRKSSRVWVSWVLVSLLHGRSICHCVSPNRQYMSRQSILSLRERCPVFYQQFYT